MKKTASIALAAALAALAAGYFALRTPDEAARDEEEEQAAARAELPAAQAERPAAATEERSGSGAADTDSTVAASGEEEDTEEDDTDTDDESPAEEDDPEEKAVDAFDSATDRWMEKRNVTMDDIYAFSAAFKKVPESRRRECLDRALNLVPDDNIMLLAGILMDKETPPELQEAVFDDVLNRAEEVKKPILETIYKDRTHHCWPSVAWIFDITGREDAP